MFRCECPYCHQHMEVEDQYEGMSADCPNCGKEISLVREVTPRPAPSPAAQSEARMDNHYYDSDQSHRWYQSSGAQTRRKYNGKCKVSPLEGEEVLAELEGELWASSSNAAAQLIGTIFRIFSMFLGIRKCAYLVLTSKRIIFYKKSVCLWVFPREIQNISILPQGISDVGYIRKGSCLGCFCSTYYLELTMSSGCVYLIQMKGVNEDEAARYANLMYAAIKQ